MIIIVINMHKINNGTKDKTIDAIKYGGLLEPLLFRNKMANDTGLTSFLCKNNNGVYKSFHILITLVIRLDYPIATPISSLLLHLILYHKLS